MTRQPAFRRVTTATAVLLLGAAALAGCALLPADAPAAAATPVASAAPAGFESQFTTDGSLTLSTQVADQLEVRLDLWAVDPKQTRQWTPEAEKSFGFAVNVYDGRVDEKSVLAQKRRVFLSNVTITSVAVQSSGQSTQNPFQFAADPRTLVPTDTIRSDRGLLLNSFQGGLLVPAMTIHQLPADATGITLSFALDVWVEGAAGDEASFSRQTVYQAVPIAIFPATPSPSASTNG